MRFQVREGTPAARAATVLKAITRHRRHRSWPADLPASTVAWGAVQGHRPVTDAYLALDRGLAATHPDVAERIGAR